ncbi:hypothetical protein SAMN02949497_3942 [Methylomagnum ishizawai]|uniref:DUF4412 domain-containing protein n=1 Tax=Methylomagnum ishizawai TaxID=1760988 RepID=A0A1Y6D7V0_9GAMM|nr:hypothetical protein [Methylomagnum ishizawai]SMF96542.1 hypothetical protein SAMN02949497_3942 [Methylomagnum ishizawai]
MSSRYFTTALFAALLPLWTAPAGADTVIEYRVEQGKHSVLQPVIIKAGTVLVKGAGGDGNLDVLYEREAERLVLIDHKKQRYTPITDERVGRIAQQAEDLQPVLRGIGEQLRKLSPKQREKWEQMLGGVSLDQFDATRKAAASTRLLKTGVGKQFAGVNCQEMNVVKGGAKALEFCLADPAALKLGREDAETLRALIGFTQKLAEKAQGLTSQLGMDLPMGGLAGLAGVPIELRDLDGKHPLAMRLNRVDGETVAAAPKVPEGYREKSLELWR